MHCLLIPHFFLSSPSRTGFVGIRSFDAAPLCRAVRPKTEAHRCRRELPGLGLAGQPGVLLFQSQTPRCPFLPGPRPMLRGEPVAFSSPILANRRSAAWRDWLSSLGAWGSCWAAAPVSFHLLQFSFQNHVLSPVSILFFLKVYAF